MLPLAVLLAFAAACEILTTEMVSRAYNLC